jgi:hypothetical protein
VHRVDGDGSLTAESRINLANGEYALRVLECKRLEEHAIDKREDRGVCADADGKRKDSNGGEAGVRTDPAKSVAEVLRESIEKG